MRGRQTDWREPKSWPLWIWGTATVVGAISLFCCVPIGWNIYSEMDVLDAADTEQLEAAATAFGRRTDKLGCEEESLARVDRCSVETKAMDALTDEKLARQKECLAETLHFHRYCLEAARPNPQFCARIRGRDAQAGVKLQHDVCSARYPTFEAPGCRQVVQQSWLACQLDAK